MAKIDKAGVYDLPREFYHGDAAIGPSLSASGAKLLMSTCPAEFWHDSYLNPDFTPTQKAEFDIGSAAHLIMLEPSRWGDQVVEIDADNFRTKAAQEARDSAYSAGKIPLLAKQRGHILAMREVLLRHELAAQAFTEGAAEESFFWKDADTGIWCKARPDWRRSINGRQIVVDYKTSTSASPRDFARRAWDNGYFQQDPWYCDGVEAVIGERPDFWFIVQQKTPPYLVTVCRLDERARSWGDMLNRQARRMFAVCVATGQWPGYRDPRKPGRDVAFEISLPGYAEFQLEERHEAGEFASPLTANTNSPEQARLRRAAGMQAPAEDIL